MTITFRDMPPSDALKEAIDKKIARVKKHFRTVTTVDVTVQAPHKHQHKGKIYGCHIEARLPHKDPCVIGRDNDHHAHEDPFVAVRDAFAALEKRLEHLTAQQRR